MGDDLGANITNCQYIGSYNWVSDHENLSIIVPGSPREWREQQLPCAVPPDIQGHHRDQYDHRMRSTPLLPLLLAVNYWYERARLQPLKFHWHDIDFVTNRNSLRHLLRMLRADANRAAGKGGTNGGGAHGGRECNRGNFKYPNSQPFRIDIELAGTKTIVLSPWESDAFEPCLVGSYGLNFEYAFTREADAVSSLDSAGGSGRHHRINSYVRPFLFSQNSIANFIHRTLAAYRWSCSLRLMHAFRSRMTTKVLLSISRHPRFPQLPNHIRLIRHLPPSA